MVKVATLQPQFMRRDDIERAVQDTISAERSEKVKEDEIIQQAQLAMAQRYGSATTLPLSFFLLHLSLSLHTHMPT